MNQNKLIKTKARVSFNAKTKPAHLTIEQIKETDAGEYRCRVDFKKGRTINTIISLKVIVLPSDLKIIDAQKPEVRLDGLIGPFNEGAELRLNCISFGGNPRPNLIWLRDYNVIDENYQHFDKEGKLIEKKSCFKVKNKTKF